MSVGVQPYRWGQVLELIDQRRLPQESVWLTITSPDAAAEAIRDMVVRGAPAIGVTAAFALALMGSEAANHDAWQHACATLNASRPTAVNLGWAVARMDRARSAALAAGAAPETLALSLRAEAEAIAAEDLAMNRRIGDYGANAIDGDTVTVLTHCNTGGLATAGWGTALGVIRSLHAAGRLREAWATETRPYWQGARLTAWELKSDGIPFRLLPDSAVGAALAAGKIDAVVVGADRIAADGSVANKIGTYTIAVLAARHSVPFYVAAPVTTVDLTCPDGTAIPIEFRDPREVTEWRSSAVAPKDTPAWNPAFDVTPPDLITALILDTGVVRPPFAPGLREALAAV